jgi:hypothetical protein
MFHMIHENIYFGWKVIFFLRKNVKLKIVYNLKYFTWRLSLQVDALIFWKINNFHSLTHAHTLEREIKLNSIFPPFPNISRSLTWDWFIWVWRIFRY